MTASTLRSVFFPFPWYVSVPPFRLLLFPWYVSVPPFRLLFVPKVDVQLAPALLRLSPGSKLLELCPKFAFWVPQEGRRRKSQPSSRSTLFTSRFKIARAMPEIRTLGGKGGEEEASS
ncbi:hypothetical protein BDR03DRAFT_277868 [Suillus americanus]|nr:hypothetical protein BDR03DRAFT_277868 [Suillus americanus]